MRKITAILLLAALLLCGCGERAAEGGTETTVSGMVVSVDGTKVQLMSTENMNMGSRPSRGESDGEGSRRPEGNFTMPEGDFTMPEGFEGFGGGNMPSFGGQRPEGAEGDFAMPEGDFTMPEGFEGFGGGNMPSFGGQRPEGAKGDFTMPEGFEGGDRQSYLEGLETIEVDLAGAHISVEIDGGKASGTMEDIKVGSRLTITMVDGKATRVVVSQSSFGGFGGGNMPGFGGNRGERPNRGEGSNTDQQSA